MRTTFRASRAPRLDRGLILFVAFAWPLTAAAQTEVEQRVAARSGGTVSIENVAGSVTVTGWDRNEVEVTGTLERDVKELVVEEAGGNVEIRVELPRRQRNSRSAAYLEVRVPRSSSLDLEVVSAEVAVEDVEGKLDVESVSGSVKISGAARAVSVETVSGDVGIAADGAAISVESVSGRIDVTGAGRSLDVETVSGRVAVAAEGIETADVESLSGNVELSASLAAGADVDVSSHSGGVDLLLAPSTSARFEVTTFSGRIDNELGPPASRVSRWSPGKKLEFTLGGGDARISVESFSGNVRLRSR